MWKGACNICALKLCGARRIPCRSMYAYLLRNPCTPEAGTPASRVITAVTRAVPIMGPAKPPRVSPLIQVPRIAAQTTATNALSVVIFCHNIATLKPRTSSKDTSMDHYDISNRGASHPSTKYPWASDIYDISICDATHPCTKCRNPNNCRKIILLDDALPQHRSIDTPDFREHID